MGVYDPLTRYLQSLEGDVWNADFAEVERIISRPLPESAYQHRPWWANQKAGNQSQARAWRDAGWETGDVNLARKTVRFERKRANGETAGGSPAGRPLDDLWQKAERLTGLNDRDTLIEMALRELIQNELKRQVVELGGSDPHATAAPRRRFW